MAPSLVSFFQVRLNLGVPDDKEIYTNLQDIPARQRSAIAKTALLIYFRGQNDSIERGARTANRKSAPDQRPAVVPQAVNTATVEIETRLPEEAVATENNITTGNKEKLKGLLNLIQ